MLKPLILNGDFKYVLDALEKGGKSMFVTGRAGTGKSTLLKLFRNSTRKRVVVLAPTGIAALNVQGQTIHSFFGFPARPLMTRDIKKRRQRGIYKKIDLLIIDEISMVRADLLDNIDRFLQLNRENPQPFGGVQVVFFGDMFQLPPVVAHDAERMLFQSHYESPYFFSAKVMDGYDMEMIELRKIYRQEGRHFLRLLEAVRMNTADYEDLEDLNERYLPNFDPEDFWITLCATNRIADRINERALAQLSGQEYIYPAEIGGEFNPLHYPTDMLLKFRVGAQVMFIKNDPEGLFVNGTIGKVVELDEDLIRVVILQNDKERLIDVPILSWEILKYTLSEKNPEEIETEVIGTFEQYPLRAAWAVTIHKSQGKTFDKVIIDLGHGAFAHGQTYVALSRCRTLDGVVLRKTIKPGDIITDERVIDFYERYF